MEHARFEELCRALARERSRRVAIGAALVGWLGASSRALEGGDAAAKKKHKKHKKGKGKGDACGGSCTPCQACFNGACTQVVDGAACGGGGACFAGECRTCPSGQVLAVGLCATPCTQQADCDGAGAACLALSGDDDPQKPRFCVVVDAGGPQRMPPCPSGHATDCDTGLLCIDYASGLVCAPPA